MRHTAHFSLAVCAVAWILPVLAMAEPLTLDGAVRQALDHSPALLAGRETTRAAELGVEQTRSSLWPRLVLNANYRYSGPVPELTIDTGIQLPGSTESLVMTNDLGTPHYAAIGLQGSWRAWDWGVRQTMSQAAQAAAQAAGAEEAGREVELAHAVRMSYLAAVFYGLAEEITGRGLEVAQREQEDRVVRLASGLGSRLEVTAATARVAELEARLVEAAGQREVAEGTLRLLIGLPPEGELELTDGLEVMTTSGCPVRQEGHPSLVRLQWLAGAVEDQVRAVKRSFWPTLDLFAGATYQFPVTFVQTEEAGFAWAAGVMLTWELFDGFARQHRAQELEARAAATGHLEEASREELTRATMEANNRRQSAEAGLQAARRQREAAEAYLATARIAQQSGMGTAIDLLQAEVAVDAAAMAEARALFASALAGAELLRSAGVSVCQTAP
ncbi:MAG: TolC family protein [Bradymonadales bacterium]|nr:TolC family protein [Bradymonadales bacterium]